MNNIQPISDHQKKRPFYIKTGEIDFGSIRLPKMERVFSAPSQTEVILYPIEAMKKGLHNSGIDDTMSGFIFHFLLDNGKAAGEKVISGITNACKLTEEPRDYYNGHHEIEILTETLKQLWRKKIIISEEPANQFSLNLVLSLDERIGAIFAGHSLPWTQEENT